MLIYREIKKLLRLRSLRLRVIVVFLFQEKVLILLKTL